MNVINILPALIIYNLNNKKSHLSTLITKLHCEQKSGNAAASKSTIPKNELNVGKEFTKMLKSKTYYEHAWMCGSYTFLTCNNSKNKNVRCCWLLFLHGNDVRHIAMRLMPYVCVRLSMRFNCEPLSTALATHMCVCMCMCAHT